MLFPKRFWPGIADGSVTLTFRRWRRQQVLAGRRYRTPAGIVEVPSVTIASPDEIRDDEARRAGHRDAASVVAELPDRPDSYLFRIEFHAVTEPDPRAALAASADLDEGAIAEITRRLDRLDGASSHGPWTRETLALIRDQPAIRAADLAGLLGRDRASFKIDVRKLKNLGLTESLDVGYRLSLRGRAYVAST
ncbi:MAG TPA: hypothetical protein VFH02_02960 [Jiangellaceae bacterium]|nr:hypothetical protein [Jiangellaceae bacterium]